MDKYFETIAVAASSLGPAGCLAAGAAGLVVFGAAIAFAYGAGHELWVKFCRFMERLGPLMGDAGSQTVLAFLSLTWVIFEALAAAVLLSVGPSLRRLSASLVSGRKRVRRAYEFATSGHRTHATFAQFAAAKTEEEAAAKAEDEDIKSFRTGDHSATKPEDLPAFDRAIAILGITAEQARDMRKVRQRYRELMMVVHPDKQFPNQLFAQMINEAMDVLKRENGVA